MSGNPRKENTAVNVSKVPENISVLHSSGNGMGVESFREYMVTHNPKGILEEYRDQLQSQSLASSINEVFYDYKTNPHRCEPRTNNKVEVHTRRGSLAVLNPNPTGSGIDAMWVDGFQKKHAYICTKDKCKVYFIDNYVVGEEISERISWYSYRKDRTTHKVLGDDHLRLYNYWPVEQFDNKDIGNFKLSWISSQTYGYGAEIYRKTRIGVLNQQDKHSRIVTHFQLLSWPKSQSNEETIPETTDHFIRLLLDVQKNQDARRYRDAPLLVQCSSGCGRTGAYVLMDICIRRLYEEDRIHILSTLETMRNQQSNFIQSENIYLFCYRALYHQMSVIFDHFEKMNSALLATAPPTTTKVDSAEDTSRTTWEKRRDRLNRYQEARRQDRFRLTDSNEHRLRDKVKRLERRLDRNLHLFSHQSRDTRAELERYQAGMRRLQLSTHSREKHLQPQHLPEQHQPVTQQQHTTGRQSKRLSVFKDMRRISVHRMLLSDARRNSVVIPPSNEMGTQRAMNTRGMSMTAMALGEHGSDWEVRKPSLKWCIKSVELEPTD